MASTYISDAKLDELVSTKNASFKLNFTDSIVRFKQITHQCHINCLSGTKDLASAEACSSRCTMPLATSISKINDLTSEVELQLKQCRNGGIASKLSNCFKEYELGLESIKDEINYVFNGYYTKMKSTLV